MNHVWTTSDLILLASGFVSLSTIVGLFIKLTWWLSNQFSQQRELSYKLHKENNVRFTRLELWANKRGFQPGIDPYDFNGGSDHREDN